MQCFITVYITIFHSLDGLFMKRIILTGGTGFLGSHLLARLTDFEVVVLTRSPASYTSYSARVTYRFWSGKESITSLLEGAYAVINLAGENIGLKPWTKRQRERIILSRTLAAETIKSSIESCIIPPRVWIQASATGFYGRSKGDSFFDESSPKGEGSFLAAVCEQWEKPIRELEHPVVRTVIIRTGVVLSPDALFMKQLTLPFLFRVAVVLGDGKNYLPWISLTDELRALHFLLVNDYCRGTYNLVAPTPVTMGAIVSCLKEYRSSWLTFHVPTCFIRSLFGKAKSEELILANQLVKPSRLLQEGFSFRWSTLESFIKNLSV